VYASHDPRAGRTSQPAADDVEITLNDGFRPERDGSADCYDIPGDFPLHVDRAAKGDDIPLDAFVAADADISAKTDHVARCHLSVRAARGRRRSSSRWGSGSCAGQFALSLNIQVTGLEDQVRIGAKPITKLLAREAFSVDGHHTADDLDHADPAACLQRDQRHTLLQRNDVKSFVETRPEVGRGFRG
jgi:hypothetical protein